MKFRKILVPVDFSDFSRAALDAAVELARASEGSLTLVNVYQLPLSVPHGIVDASYVQAVVDDSERGLKEWRKDVVPRGVKTVEIASLLGTSWDRIVAYAREGAFDLIVMGTHGRTGLQHVFLGSVAERVVRHASCPVLVVRPKAMGGPA